MNAPYTLHPEDIERTLDQVQWGTLTLQSTRTLVVDHKEVPKPPYTVPVNFVYDDERIYIHGSNEGEKIEYLDEGLDVQFLVVDTYSLLPSYFVSSAHPPCRANQCFASIKLVGRAETSLTPATQMHALELLIRKLQPVAGIVPGDCGNGHKNIENSSKRPAVIEITVEEIITKANFCQQNSLEEIESILKNLELRGSDNDIRTMEMILKYYTV